MSGTISDISTTLGIAYVQVTVSSGLESATTLCDVFGNYSTTVPDGNIVVSTSHAAYYGTSTTQRSLSLQPLPFAPSGLIVVLSWDRTPSDLDLRGISQCGVVSFGSKLAIHGGVPWRLDKDVVDGYGPETIRALNQLPCGDYEIYVSLLTEDTFFRSGTATVRVYSDTTPEPLFVFRSITPSGNFRGWHVLTYRVRVLNQETRERSYSIIPQLRYTNSQPSPGFLPQCAGDSQWCSRSIAAVGLKPLLTLLGIIAVGIIAM